MEGGGGGDHDRQVSSNQAVASQQGADGTGSMGSVDIDRTIRNVVRGGMLYVHLTRAYDLKSSRGSITRRFKVKVRVGTTPTNNNNQFKYNRTAERSRLRNRQWIQATDPVFDETVDFFIDGDTANNPHTIIKAEVWVIRTLRPPLFKGAVTVPLRRVIGSGRVRDVFVLEGVSSGKLEMELEWLSAMSGGQ